MRRGFIFNSDLCVRCQACCAACILENGWNVKVRTVYQVNPEGLFAVPVINISMACNHCEKPACLEGCPGGAFYREASTGAVLVNEKKCLGCNYCTWNCPYDSPKQDIDRRIIVKCNLCSSLLREGGHPACASACPTGALRFGDVHDNSDNSRYSWLPGRELVPALQITGNPDNIPLRIIPEDIFSAEIPATGEKGKRISDELSLVIFSFLSSVSVAMMCSLALTGKQANKLLILSVTILAGLISLLHLGRKMRAWRAVANILKSPLSREIASYLIYLFLSAAALISGSGGLIIASAVAGLILLIIIDSVYSFPDRRVKFLFHSGQTFLTGLLAGSFFSGMTVSFLFIGSIKLISGVLYIISEKHDPVIFGYRFLRLALLIATGVIQITGISVHDPFIICLFLSGELIDRFLFYYDFRPDNIKTTISEYIKY
jgi:Fe-S-cluster-containing dehydrogenase component/DMSO reductase anchor subunit